MRVTNQWGHTLQLMVNKLVRSAMKDERTAGLLVFGVVTESLGDSARRRWHGCPRVSSPFRWTAGTVDSQDLLGVLKRTSCNKTNSYLNPNVIKVVAFIEVFPNCHGIIWKYFVGLYMADQTCLSDIYATARPSGEWPICQLLPAQAFFKYLHPLIKLS